MTGDPTIGVGVIGLGFMGQTHVAAYRAAEAASAPCRLLAVCDPKAERRAGHPSASGNLGAARTERMFDPGVVAGYERPEDLLADEGVGLVSICTPTPTHADLAIAALEAGKHVLVEKPVAVGTPDVARLAEAAREAGTLCMPAMCVRFWPGYAEVRQLVASEAYGPVVTARFERLGAAPGWASFYDDPRASGDALFDLHIHDADFVHFCFGPPDEVLSVGTTRHLSTAYRYDRPGAPAMVIAEGGWLADPTARFRARFVVEFEHALAEFDIAQTPSFTVHSRGADVTPPTDTATGYEREIRHVVDAIAAGQRRISPGIGDALAVTRTLEAERASLASAAPVRVASA